MFQIAAAGVALVMILAVALRGVRLRASWGERAYTAAVGIWTLLGGGLYNVAGSAHLMPHLVRGPVATSVFGLGTVILGIIAA